ncbi:MAG: hypothetical protein LBD64_06610 [Odoribacteraceae bacterium]|jgi:hypothetical protein|nr:hypothetical protein [Odoribacteraceae bacterium]
MPNSRWLPESQQGFKDKLDVTITTLFSKREAFGFGTTTDNGKWLDTVFSPAVTRYVSAFNDWKDENTRSHIEVTAIHEAREKLEPLYRHLARILHESLSVDNLDLDKMGLPLRGTDKPTPSPVSTTPPDIQIRIVRDGVLGVAFSSADPASSARPAGQHGVEVCFAISDTPIVEHFQLQNSRFATRPPVEIEFFGQDRGKLVYIAARWENNVGKKGPFTRIYQVMIP